MRPANAPRRGWQVLSSHGIIRGRLFHRAEPNRRAGGEALISHGESPREVWMFAGHIGAGLAIGRADRRINVGVLISAALLLDPVLWLFILLGWESVSIPADFAASHQPHFTFPYSHSLVGSLAWSVFAALAAYWWLPRSGGTKLRAAALVGTAVFSHWLLDALVHAPELPLAGPQSRMVGLGLWACHPAGADGGGSDCCGRPVVISSARADIPRVQVRCVRPGRGGPRDLPSLV